MPDTIRTRSALQTLLGDNTAGDISAQDLRDLLVSAVPALFTDTISGVDTYDASNGFLAELTLTGNVTNFSVTNLASGHIYIITFVQDATGSRTLSGTSGFLWQGGTPPTLSTGAGSRDVFIFYYNGTNLVEINHMMDVR